MGSKVWNCYCENMAGNQLQLNKKIAIRVQEVMDSMSYYSDLYSFFLKSWPNVLWQKSVFEDGKIYMFIFSNLELKFTFPSIVIIGHKPH